MTAAASAWSARKPAISLPARLEVADLLAQHGDVLITPGFAGGDRFPIGEVALHRLLDGALTLACQFSTPFAASP
ncbi:hypothetical protein [Nocardia asiatica]|uniref:hypothetical protein n=1 Tax=Nocardia asiatica TaxID=209252 RepID=UPI003EDF74F4